MLKSYIFDVLKPEQIKFVVASDIKQLLIMAGLQTATACHPCPYCIFQKGTNPCCAYELRTVGSIHKECPKWVQETGENRQRLKDYFNCQNAPLFKDSSSVTILDKCSPPELHFLLGVVNHMLQYLIELWTQAEAWPRLLCLKRDEFHGGHFNGNQCHSVTVSQPS